MTIHVVTSEEQRRGEFFGPKPKQRVERLLDLRDELRPDPGTLPTCYVAGPMRGLPEYNFPAFAAATRELRACGFKVHSPHENDLEAGLQPDPEGDPDAALPLKVYMQKDLQQVCSSEVVFVLPGWEKSKGANLEVHVAHSVDVPVIELASFRGVSPDHHVPRDITTKATNPKDAIGSDKLPIHLWPETATVMGVLGLLDGMLKYGRSNWREAGVRATIYIDALRRHLAAYAEGEDIDPDSGVPHLAHLGACWAILVDADAAEKLNDDRNYNGASYRSLVESLTPHVARLKDKHSGKSPKHYTIGDAA